MCRQWAGDVPGCRCWTVGLLPMDMGAWVRAWTSRSFSHAEASSQLTEDSRCRVPISHSACSSRWSTT